jgi:hypothetical protein
MRHSSCERENPTPKTAKPSVRLSAIPQLIIVIGRLKTYEQDANDRTSNFFNSLLEPVMYF